MIPEDLVPVRCDYREQRFILQAFGAGRVRQWWTFELEASGENVVVGHETMRHIGYEGLISFGRQGVAYVAVFYSSVPRRHQHDQPILIHDTFELLDSDGFVLEHMNSIHTQHA